MKIHLSILALFVATFADTARAQPTAATQAPKPQPAPNPLDSIADAMPFDVPYGAPISLDRADAATAAAVAESKRRNWKMNIAVVDSGSNLVSFKRMDGAQLSSILVSEQKAHAAASFRRETKVFETGIYQNNFNQLLGLPGIATTRGGIPIIENGKLIGAIGCSGGTSAQDEVVCKAGVAALK